MGALIGAMAQIVPYAFVLLLAFGVSLLAWRQEGDLDILMIMLALLIGSLFGNMASVTPYGVTIYLAVVMATMLWRTQGGGISTSGPTSTIALILFLIVSVGFLFNGTFTDFCNPTGSGDVCLNPGTSGYITAWSGCVSTCTITAFTFLGASPFAFLLSGDLLGFLSSLFGGFGQSGLQLGDTGNFFWSIISGIITAAVGAILLFLGSGIGVQADILASGAAITPNDPGTRIYQSLGIGLLLWAVFTSFVFNFGQLFSYIGFGLGAASGLGGGALYLMLLTTYTYELYRQGKTITA